MEKQIEQEQLGLVESLFQGRPDAKKKHVLLVQGYKLCNKAEQVKLVRRLLQGSRYARKKLVFYIWKYSRERYQHA